MRVPGGPESAESGHYRFRQMVNKPVVQAEAEGGPTDGSQSDVVTRQIHALEPVDFFELAQAVRLLFPIGEVLVHEIGDPPVGAGSYRLRNERIRRSLVPVLQHREDMYCASIRSSLIKYQFHETNHAFAEERPNENATVKKRPRVLARALE